MKNLSIFKMMSIAAIAAILSLSFSGCKDDEPAPPAPDRNIVQLAQSIPVLSTLVTAINTAGLANTLSGPGPFTVFAPTNQAFDNLPDGVLDALLANPAALAEILQYHVVSGKILSSQLSSGSVPTLLTGESLTISVSGGSVTINGSSSVTAADNEATNGVVHVINEVLIPDGWEPPAPSIVAIAQATPELSTLVAALSRFPDLVNTLDSDGTFTVFAPTNDGFTALLAAIGQTQLSDVPDGVLRDILEYHVIATGVIKSTDLSDGQTATTVSGEDVTVSINGGVFISGSQVTLPDVEASNGVVHVMEDVMVNPSILPIVGTIVAPAFFNKDFTILTSAVLAASPEILELLLSDGPSNNGLTLFAPTNAAFAAAGITQLPDQATLDAVLAYHVVDGTVNAADLPVTTAGAAAIASLGGDFYLTNKGGGTGVFINGTTQVVATDIAGSNGVVHVIDRTILPPSSNIVEIALSFDPDEFTQLVAALLRTDGENPDLLAALGGAGAYTVFAPTDAAFVALLATNPDWNSVNDIPLDVLTAVLTHHVIASPRVFSSDLESGSVTTLNGDIAIDATAGTITDGAGNTANLTETLDVLATNGVIHVIDAVLVPAP